MPSSVLRPPSSANAALPPTFAAALVLLAAFAAMLIWDQSTWWGSKDEYMFGYLVPLFVAYIVYDRWGKIRGLLVSAADRSDGAAVGRLDGAEPIRAPVEQQSPNHQSPVTNHHRRSGFATAARALAGCALLGGVAMFALGAFYRAGSGASQPGSLAMAMGFGALAVSLIYLAAPDTGSRSTSAGMEGRAPSRPAATPDGEVVPPSVRSGVRTALRALTREPRWQLAALFLFPALVWLVSAPLVSAVENSLSTFLLNKVTVVVFFTFDALGYPLERQGSVLVLPLGQVGVAEACSGIRSLTGSIFSGCFLAAAFLPSLPRKIGLVFMAVVLAFVMNIARSLTLTAIAYAKGPDAIEGSIHDITGFAVLGCTFVGLLCLLPLFGRSASADERTDGPTVGPVPLRGSDE